MEIKSVIRGHVYVAWMNSVYANAESTTAVVAADSYERLVQFIDNQKCEPYRDSLGYGRSYKEGSPLHDYNPIGVELNPSNAWFHQGIFDTWVDCINENGVIRVVDPNPDIVWLSN